MGRCRVSSLYFTNLTKPSLFAFSIIPEVHTFQGKKKDVLGNHMDEGKYSVLCSHCVSSVIVFLEHAIFAKHAK